MDKDKNLFVYKLDDGETYWFTAYSVLDALEQMVETFHDGSDDILDFVNIEKICDDAEFTIRIDSDDMSFAVTKKIKDWADEGRGFLASTVY